MEVGGWIPVSLIAGFRRVQALTQDLNMMVDVGSMIIEVTLFQGSGTFFESKFKGLVLLNSGSIDSGMICKINFVDISY
jgi:hypothetical protein